MSEFVDLNEICTRVAEISLKFPASQCVEYKRTRHATANILEARDAADAATRMDHLQSALDAMEDARPEVPEEYLDDWDDCRDALEEEINDE